MDNPSNLAATQILYDRTNVLRLAISLLLVFSMPVIGSGDIGHPETRFVGAVHNEFGLIDNSACQTGLNYGVILKPNHSIDPFAGYVDPDLNLKMYDQGASKQRDERNVYDMGVDPATLNPEGLDLNIFPSFEISAELSLMPALSYSENHVLGRLGRVQYGPPKQWRNHYGEIVVLLGPTKANKIPVGDPLPGTSIFNETDRQPVSIEVQVFFINSSGQQVNFYPDPNEMGTGEARHKSITPNGQVSTWYSEDGTYRLVDLNAASATGAFNFELRSSSGLTFSFEPYAFHLSAFQGIPSPPYEETLTRHFRVDKIQDRYGNDVDVVYRDEAPGYSGEASIQPWKVQGHDNVGNMLQELVYSYDSRNRIHQLQLPAFGSAQTQTYTFYYLDSDTLIELPLADGGSTNRLKLNNIYPQTLSATNTAVTIPPLKTVSGYIGTAGNPTTRGIFINFQELGFNPEIGVDFGNLFTSGGYSETFKSATYPFHMVDAENNYGLYTPSGQARQNQTELEYNPDPIRYRYKLDAINDYPNNTVADLYPDFVHLSGFGTSGLEDGEATASILPRMKHGDLLAWKASNGEIVTRTLDVQGASLVYTANGTYQRALTSGTPDPSGQDVYFIRKDQRDRIAEIEYPAVDSSSRKRLLFKYAENSRNHAEIEEVLTYDEPLPSGQARLLSQTTYTYEQVLVQTSAEDLGPQLLEPLAESLWRNCSRTGRALEEINGVEGVDIGIHRLNRHEVIDILRQKRVRYYEPGLQPGAFNNCVFENYRDLETYYGGAWRFALMTRSARNENQPLEPDLLRTCDEIEWGVAQKPFRFTWQINPDGSAQVFDLSADGVGLDPILAYAYSGVRIFKTYQFDTNFKQAFSAAGYGHFLSGTGSAPFSPYYEYFPTYVLNGSAICAPCTIPDLERFPTWPSNRAIPTMKDIFDLANTKAFSANIQLFEPIPLYGYSLLKGIDPGDQLKKLALGTIHGSIQGGENNPNRTYYRISALHGLQNAANNYPGSEVALIDKFLRGKLVSDVSTAVGSVPVNYNYEVPWQYGGRLDSSSCFQHIHHRRKNHRLRPHAQIQLQKLSGLAWNDTQNILDLAPDASTKVSPWVAEASRYSNGGFLGEGSATGATDGSGQSTLSGVVQPGAGIQAGDYFYYKKKMYQLVSDVSTTTNEVTIKPEIGSTAQSLTNLKFYRFFDPGAPSPFPYIGYDHFGNNAFKATYKRNELKFPNVQDKANGDDEGLVPDFFDAGAVPFNLSLNDSTAQSNQDEVNWQYFGRITRSFVSGLLPLNAEDENGDIETYSTWHTGMLTDMAYPTSNVAYDWLPTDKVSYFLPITLTGGIDELSMSKLQNIGPIADLEDLRTSYRYYRPTNTGYSHSFNNTNPMSHGRVSLEWTGKSKSHPSTHHFTATRYEYDAQGWLSVRDSATFKFEGGYQSDYGTRTLFTHDEATGLATEEKALVFYNPTWNPNGGSAEARLVFNGHGVQRGRTETDYDLLGRKTETRAYDAKDHPFGNVVTMAYPTQTHSVTLTKDAEGNSLFQTEMTFANGQGQPRAKLRQRGGETNKAYGVFSDYDAFGRSLTVSAEQEHLADFSTLEDLSEGMATDSGYNRTIYNLRGEAFGSVVYDDGEATQSAWTLQDQGASGNLISLHVRQVAGDSLGDDEDPDYVNIKRRIQDDHGLLFSVQDFQISRPEALWTDEAESSLLSAVGTLTQPLAGAEYTYDRLNKVVKAKVGASGPVQLRTFIHDQRGRLRQETHPEMPDVIINYEDFDHFDNPQQVTHKNQTETLRYWESHYDAAGNIRNLSGGLSDTTTTVTTDYVYNYQASFTSPQLTPDAWPELPRAVRHSDTNGGVYLYWNTFDVDRGLLANRSLYHNRSGFPGESAVNLAVFDMAGSASPPPTATEIIASYSYDSLGRMESLTYPAKAQGMAKPTELSFSYQASTGLLTNVTDLAFKEPLPLVKSLSYGVGDQIGAISLATANSSDAHLLTRHYDSLNRLGDWGVSWSSASIQYQANRYYGYDHAGRIQKIGFNHGHTKGFTYRYDGLGQISEAKFLESATATPKTWTYGYDPPGFGNLVSLKINGTEQFGPTPVDLANNQLTTDGDYSPLGEMTRYTQNGADYIMAYNDLGRMATMSVNAGTGLDTEYHYDHAGMRVFTEVTGSQSSLEERRTLYFYDADGMVLCEWVSEKDTQANWTAPRWNRSYIYLAGKSSITYEYDATKSVVPSSPSLTQPSLVLDGVVKWDPTTPPYEVEIADNEKKTVRRYKGLQKSRINFGKYLGFGKYRVRFKGHGTTWGEWQDLYHTNNANKDLVGEYGFDRSGKDHSHFQNHVDNLDAFGFTYGQYFDALSMQPGDMFTIANPHQFKSPESFGTISIWLKIPDQIRFDPIERRRLWDYQHFTLWVGKAGDIVLEPDGQGFQTSSLGISLGKWSHIAVIYGNSTTKVYINGNLGLAATNINSTFSHGDMIFGNTDLGFKGLLDRIRIFNRALTPEEIKAEATP